MKRSFHHAVVVGGSIAGLLAARVLAETFERVTLIERDEIASEPEPRKGIPQGHHVHNLLLRGQLELEALFPGLVAELLDAGATTITIGKALAWHHGGAWRRMRESDAASPIAMSRPLLESVIAQRVRSISNITLLERTRVLGPRRDDEGGIGGLDVTSVGDGDEGRAITCDLVVDASGRGSATPHWLAALGVAMPIVEKLSAPITYASCVYRRNDAPREWKQLFVTGAPAKKNGCIAPMEGDRWLVSVAALFDEPAPTDHASMLEFAASLPTPAFQETLTASEPLTDVVRVRFPGSQRQRYDRLARFPEGLIVIGDAVCSFNPLFGQGMTVSAVEAGLLGSLLRRERAAGEIRPDFAKRWFRAIRPAIDAAWNTVLVEDYRYAELAAARPARLAPLQWYLGRVHRATHRDPEVTDRLVRVISFVASPLSLLTPRIVAKVLWPRSAG